MVFARPTRHPGRMPQLQLPIFPVGAVPLSPELAVVRDQDKVTYVHGSLPVFQHRVDDLKSFRLISAQLYLNGHVKQAALARAFGVSPISLKRAVKLYEEQGAGGFWRPRRVRGPSVLTPERLAQVQAALDEGEEPKAIAQRLQLNYETLRKAVAAGRLRRVVKKKIGPESSRTPRPG